MKIDVLVGPGVNVDTRCLGRLLEAWPSGHRSPEMALRLAADEEVLEELVLTAESEAIVVCPGVASRSRIAEAVVERGRPTASVQLATRLLPTDDLLAAVCATSIYGRGIDGFHWAVRHLLERRSHPPETIGYGNLPDQVADLRVPASDPPFPVVVLLHGGGWTDSWTRDLMDGLAVDLARRGYASWNMEYRRLGPSGGGWPTTFEDVRAGINHLALIGPKTGLDLDRVVLLGHSAGGQLALWAAAEIRPKDQGGTDRLPARPSLVVSLAGVTDLVEGALRMLAGEDVIPPLLGGLPNSVPERYAAASPLARLPIGIPQLLAQGLDDAISDLLEMNARYEALATESGDGIELLELPGANHTAVIDARSTHWATIADRMSQLLGFEGDSAFG